MYFFDVETEQWEGIGIAVQNTTKLITAAQTNHLTSFATGFFPTPNKIDFDFIFAKTSIQDNLTIFLLLIISFMFYLILMIWAVKKDIQDAKAVRCSSSIDDIHFHLRLSYFVGRWHETSAFNFLVFE